MSAKNVSPLRGRPRKLSSQAILDGALEVLEELPPEKLTMAHVAKKCGAAPMSIYTYYSSREVLLDAVADHVFENFSCEARHDDWQDNVLEWLREMSSIFSHYPIAQHVIASRGHVSPAWFRTWIPLLRIFKDNGLQGKQLALTFSWFLKTSIGFILAQHRGQSYQSSVLNLQGNEMSQVEQTEITDLWADLAALDHHEIVDFGFQQLIEMLAVRIATA